LNKRLDDQDNFPEWVSEKVGAIKSMMTGVMQYLASEQAADPAELGEFGAGVIAGGGVGEGVKTDTMQYKISHGKEPKGRGGWYFSPHSAIDFAKHKEGDDYISSGNDSYSDAKKQAAQWAKSKGHKKMYVLPEGVKSVVKNLKRGLKGWDKNLTGSPKDVKDRIANADDLFVKQVAGRADLSKGSPADLQNRLAKREVKRRDIEDYAPKNEGAKVDRMAKHIKSSEKKSGKSDKEAESIAWATLNKRGMLDNANKKKGK